MRLRTFAVAAFALLASCIADLEGGAPRVQLRNVWSDTVVALSMGEWRHDFQPAVAPGSVSEIVELPVAGSFDVDVVGRRDGRDTVVAIRRVRAGVGDFARIE